MSSSRYRAKAMRESVKDESGDVAEREVVKLGHRVLERMLLPDDATMIGDGVRKFLKGRGDVLILLGGTGVSQKDVTIESVRPFLQKELDGFGELFRASSAKSIGAAAALTRATAGVAGGKVVICLPGSPDAAKVAFRVFGNEIPHVLFIARS